MHLFRGKTSFDASGLGAVKPDDIGNDDSEFDVYRKRMMLAYKFRPNPLVGGKFTSLFCSNKILEVRHETFVNLRRLRVRIRFVNLEFLFFRSQRTYVVEFVTLTIFKNDFVIKVIINQFN